VLVGSGSFGIVQLCPFCAHFPQMRIGTGVGPTYVLIGVGGGVCVTTVNVSGNFTSTTTGMGDAIGEGPYEVSMRGCVIIAVGVGLINAWAIIQNAATDPATNTRGRSSESHSLISSARLLRDLSGAPSAENRC